MHTREIFTSLRANGKREVKCAQVRHRTQLCLQISFEKSEGMNGARQCTSKLEEMVGASEEAFSPKRKDSAHSQGAEQKERDEVNEAGYRNSIENFKNKSRHLLNVVECGIAVELYMYVHIYTEVPVHVHTQKHVMYMGEQFFQAHCTG